MKKIVSLLLSIIMIFSLTACGTKAEATWQEQYDLGLKYLSEAKYEEAVLAFTKAIEIDPKNPNSYAHLAQVFIEQQDYERAEEILKNGKENAIASKILDEKIKQISDITESKSYGRISIEDFVSKYIDFNYGPIVSGGYTTPASGTLSGLKHGHDAYGNEVHEWYDENRNMTGYMYRVYNESKPWGGWNRVLHVDLLNGESIDLKIYNYNYNSNDVTTKWCRFTQNGEFVSEKGIIADNATEYSFNYQMDNPNNYIELESYEELDWELGIKEFDSSGAQVKLSKCYDENGNNIFP